MSGVEVVGVVLGSLPLIISALEHYADLVQTVNRAIKYKMELKSLKHDLQAESILFLDTLERVLDGLVPALQLEQLLDNPASTLWQDTVLNEKLKDRLGRSYDVFTHTVTNMNATIRIFTERLGIDKDGKVRWTESTGLRLALKRAGFSLRKRNFDDLMEQLQKHNRYLEKFTNRSIECEPSRQSRNITSTFQKLGDYAKSVFNAFEASFKCTCEDSNGHTALLGLTPHPLQISSEITKRQSKPELHVVISGASRETSIWQEVAVRQDDENSHGQLKPMENLVRSLEELSTNTPKPTASNSKAVRYANGSTSGVQSSRSKKQVKFAPTTGSATAFTSINTSNCQSSIEQSQISSICEFLSSPPPCGYPKCIGYILDGNCKFLLHPRDRSPSPSQRLWSTLSLRQILHDEHKKLTPPLTLWDRLSLAAKFASAVLQLYASPWLQSTWSNDDVMFLQRDNKSLYEQVYLSGNMFRSGKQAIKSSPLSMFNETLVALAVILVELSLGPIEKLQTPDDLKAGIYARIVTLWRLANGNEIGTVYGPRYQSAVKRCIELAKISTSFDEQVRQEFYAGVVSVLEDQAMRKAVVI